MLFSKRTYIIADVYLPALINGDSTGLTDEDDQALDLFLDAVGCSGHWSYAEEGEGFARCEVTGLYADCCEVTAHDPIPHTEGLTAVYHDGGQLIANDEREFPAGWYLHGNGEPQPVTVLEPFGIDPLTP